jgi:hypothetical protein
VASRDAFYWAQNGADLRRIYVELAVRLPCLVGVEGADGVGHFGPQGASVVVRSIPAQRSVFGPRERRIPHLEPA